MIIFIIQLQILFLMYTWSLLWCITPNKALTVIVSFDCANQAEELNHPTEAILHLKHKHTRQDLKHTKYTIQCFQLWTFLFNPSQFNYIR